MKRTAFLLWSLGLMAAGSAACSKSEPAPAPPAEPTASAETAAAPETPPAGDEANQPRREIEPAVAPGAAEAPVAKVEEPELGGEAAAIMAAARLTPGGAVDLGAGPASAEALRFLPDTTIAAFVVASPSALLDRFGFAGLKARFADKLEQASAEMKAELGHDLLDLGAWAEMGLDLSGPAGAAAIVAAGEEGYALFMTVGDRAKLDQAIAAAGEKGHTTFETEKVGDADLIAAPSYDRNVIVVRGRTVLIAGVDRREGARALARRIATQAPATSLAQAAEFTGAVRGLDVKDDAIAWTNIGFAAKATMRFPSDGMSERAQAQKSMADKLVGPLKGFALGAAARDRAVELSASLPLAADALLRRLIVNLDGTPALLAAASERPLFAFGGRIDPKVFLELAELSLAAEGESLDEARSAAKELGGVDLDRDVFGLFTGEFGFLVQGDLKRAVKDGDFDPSAFGGAVVIGLADAEGLKKLFAVAAGLEGLPSQVKIDPAGTVDIPLPGGARVHVQISGNALIASTDAELARRVAAGDASQSFVQRLDNSDLKALLSRPNQAAWGIMPVAIGSLWLMASSGHMEPMVTEPSQGASPERVAKEKELAAARARLDALRKKHEERQQQLMEQVLGGFGVTAATLDVTADGIHWRLGQYLDTSISELISGIAGAASAEEASVGELDAAYEAVFKLDNEVRLLEVKEDMAKPE